MYVISGSHWEVADGFAIKYVQPGKSVSLAWELACVNFEIIMVSVIEKLKTSTLY